MVVGEIKTSLKSVKNFPFLVMWSKLNLYLQKSLIYLLHLSLRLADCFVPLYPFIWLQICLSLYFVLQISFEITWYDSFLKNLGVHKYYLYSCSAEHKTMDLQKFCFFWVSAGSGQIFQWLFFSQKLGISTACLWWRWKT